MSTENDADTAGIRDDDSAVTYRPHTGSNGERGFRCTHDDGREVYIILNPSGGSDDGIPNVFVYIGPTGEASQDTPVHHYVLETLRGPHSVPVVGDGRLVWKDDETEIDGVAVGPVWIDGKRYPQWLAKPSALTLARNRGLTFEEV